MYISFSYCTFERSPQVMAVQYFAALCTAVFAASFRQRNRKRWPAIRSVKLLCSFYISEARCLAPSSLIDAAHLELCGEAWIGGLSVSNLFAVFALPRCFILPAYPCLACCHRLFPVLFGQCFQRANVRHVVPCFVCVRFDFA